MQKQSYSTHPNQTWDGKPEDGFNEFRPKWNHLTSPIKIWYSCLIKGHIFKAERVKSFISDSPTILVCSDCGKVDSTNFDYFSKKKGFMTYSELQTKLKKENNETKHNLNPLLSFWIKLFLPSFKF